MRTVEQRELNPEIHRPIPGLIRDALANDALAIVHQSVWTSNGSSPEVWSDPSLREQTVRIYQRRMRRIRERCRLQEGMPSPETMPLWGTILRETVSRGVVVASVGPSDEDWIAEFPRTECTTHITVIGGLIVRASNIVTNGVRHSMSPANEGDFEHILRRLNRLAASS